MACHSLNQNILVGISTSRNGLNLTLKTAGLLQV